MQISQANAMPPVATLDTADISLRDVLDTINPLEHIPFVSTLYDSITGSKPSAGSQLAGGMLFGGPIGFIASVINVAFQGETGDGVVGSMVASLSGESTTQLASAEPTIALADATPTPLPNEPANASPAEILLPKPSPRPIAAAKAQDILSLFDAPTANQAYRKAQSLGNATSSSNGLVL